MTRLTRTTIGARGQSLAIDTMSAILVFLLVTGSLTWLWTSKALEAENLLYEDEIEILAERALDTLVRSPGLPENWENLEVDKINVIGLAKRDRVLEEEKINKLMQMSQEYEHYMQVQGFWKFDTNPNISIVDESKYQNDAFCIPGSCPFQTTDKSDNPNSAYAFISHYIDLDKLDVSGDRLTIMAWVKKFPIPASSPRIISKADALDDYWWSLGTEDSNPVFSLKINDVTNTLTASDLTLSVLSWTHLAAVYDGTQMILYKNGNPSLITLPVSGDITQGPDIDTWIGGNPSSTGKWKGTIDEVVIINKALSKEEIKKIHDNGLVLGNYEETRQKLLIGSSDYYFRLYDPDAKLPGQDVIKIGEEPIEMGVKPNEFTIMQTTVRRPVVFTYHREGEDDEGVKKPHVAIAELTLHTETEKRRRS